MAGRDSDNCHYHNHNIHNQQCNCSRNCNKVMRILALADLHDHVEMLERLADSVESIDPHIIVFCGDLHNASAREAARPAALALAGLGPKVLIVPGNMDHRDTVPELWQEAGLIMLHRTCFRFGPAAFLGMGGMVAKDPRRLSDPARFYHRDEDVYEQLSAIFPQSVGATCKIVVVHQPPRGVQDTLYNGESSGSVSLRRFVEEHQPDLLLCGHIHEAQGEARVGRCLVVNVGELRRGFGAVVEIDCRDVKNRIDIKWIDMLS